MTRVLLALLVLLAVPASAADRYARPSSDCANNGDGTTLACAASSGAAGAYKGLPATLTRGDTYYLADGSYGSYTFDDSESGTTVITLTKCTSAQSAVTGYLSTLCDGQAGFGSWTFTKGYYTLNGVSRNASNWGDKAAYGLSTSGASSIDDFGSVFCAAGLTFRYANFGDLTNTSYSGSEPDEVLKGSGFRSPCTNWTLEYSYLHNAAHYCLFCANGFDGATVRYNRFAYGWGKEAIRGQINFKNGTIAFNQFHNACGNTGVGGEGCTAEIAIWDDCASGGCDNNKIYGNTFFRNNGDENSGGTIVVGGNGSSWAGSSASNTLVYNNTIAGISGSTNTGGNILVNGGTGNTCRNNLGYSIAGTFTVSCNTASNNTEVTSDPFVSFATGDLRLSGATAAGTSLSSPYNVDMTGATRGADGTWDLGAYEYSAGGSGPPAPTNIRIIGSIGAP